MEEIVLPFTLSKDDRTKAVSELTFSIQRDRSEFNTVIIQRMRFMSVYEQERHNQTNYPFQNAAYGEFKTDLGLIREDMANDAIGPRNDINFGHSRTPHLKALDMLPHWIELEFVRHGRQNDRSTISTPGLMEYQSTDPDFERISENNTKMQSLLIYNTNLVHGTYGGWEGSISCDMDSLGFSRFRDQGNGNVFTVRASMFNFMRQALGEVPSIQLSLLFR